MQRKNSTLTSSATAASGGQEKGSSAQIGDAVNYIPPFIHLSMLIHPDGIALYAKMQTDPFFKESVTNLLSRAAAAANAAQQQKQQQEQLRLLQQQSKSKMNSRRRTNNNNSNSSQTAAVTASGFSVEDIAKASSLREQLAQNKAIVDVAKAAYQHPVTAPVLRFSVPFNATTESIAEEGIEHFFSLLQQNGQDKEENVSDLSQLLPATDPDDLELYVYNVEDPDSLKDLSEEQIAAMKQHSSAVGGGGKGDVVAQQLQAAQQKKKQSNQVNHKTIPIGDYSNYPPLAPGVLIRQQLNLFSLIAAARKRRRKFIVKSGLHPSAVQDCAPLNIYAVLTIGPFWLERRALEIQEETAREVMEKNEERYMKAIHEAHAVSHNRAMVRAKGHLQVRAFNADVENFFLKLALRNAKVKQASMSVHDVVETHMRSWPEALRVREAMFQEELKKRRCLLADFVQQEKLKSKVQEFGTFY